MSATRQLAALISTRSADYPQAAITASRDALIDTIACMFAGATMPVSLNACAAVRDWSRGDSMLFGNAETLNPPFAAMVNGAAAHAFDYDDFDEPANAHPSAVIFPALLALAAEKPLRGIDILDAHIVGVEVMQRLGEAMNMDHYRRGWLSTVTLGSIGAAAACARLQKFDQERASDCLSLASSMASGLTNQGGYLAKQLNPGLAAKNGVMAAALGGAGITASDQTIDGAISLANVMGEHRPERFETALSKIGNPWSIVEHGLIMKAYPTCGYTHRVIDAAIELHSQLRGDSGKVSSVQISIPAYYLDILVYPNPETPAQAMFSAPYNVAVALAQGDFKLGSLSPDVLNDAEISRLCVAAKVMPRNPRNPDAVYDPLDADSVELTLRDGSKLRSEVGQLTGSPAKPMTAAARRAKFDDCLEYSNCAINRDHLWQLLSRFDQLDDLLPLWHALS